MSIIPCTYALVALYLLRRFLLHTRCSCLKRLRLNMPCALLLVHVKIDLIKFNTIWIIKNKAVSQRMFLNGTTEKKTAQLLAFSLLSIVFERDSKSLEHVFQLRLNDEFETVSKNWKKRVAKGSSGVSVYAVTEGTVKCRRQLPLKHSKQPF